MFPNTPTQLSLVSIRFRRKISFVTSFTISNWLKKYYFHVLLFYDFFCFFLVYLYVWLRFRMIRFRKFYNIFIWVLVILLFWYLGWGGVVVTPGVDGLVNVMSLGGGWLLVWRSGGSPLGVPHHHYIFL